MKAADGTPIAERCIMDFPEAFKFIDETAPDKETHHPKCSYRQAGMLCDCSIIWAEYHKRRANQAEGRERKLLASLADSDTVHANILRGTIAQTKAQAIHIAGLPADIEERERALRDALKYARFVHSMCCMLGAPSQITWIDESGAISSRELPGLDSRCAACRAIDAALATPAPEQPADCFGNDDSSRRVAAVKGACARAGGFGKDAEHGYAGRNAESWRWGWEYANDCLNDPNYHPPASQQPAPKRYRLNSGPCAAQIVDCDCHFCSPELEDRPAQPSAGKAGE